MKTLKKALVTGLVAVMMVVNLAGCGKFDAAAYVESCLDLLTKGETEQYMKMTGRSVSFLKMYMQKQNTL